VITKASVIDSLPRLARQASTNDDMDAIRNKINVIRYYCCIFRPLCSSSIVATSSFATATPCKIQERCKLICMKFTSLTFTIHESRCNCKLKVKLCLLTRLSIRCAIVDEDLRTCQDVLRSKLNHNIQYK
jgi:hypothetical protein